MSKSKVITMPDFSGLNIPEKQRAIYVKDEQIFFDVKMQLRTLADQVEGAEKGDYVLLDFLYANGRCFTRQIELGGKAFAELESVLLGCKSGDILRTIVHQQEVQLRVQKVRRVIEPVLTDETIASLQIPDVSTLNTYRIQYLKKHGEKITDRLFKALQQKLLDNILALTEFSLDLQEVECYHQGQCAMLQNITGDADARLMRAFGEDGTKTLEECYQRYYEENKRSFSLQLLGKTLAKQNGASPTDEEYRSAKEFYCMAFNVTDEEVENQNLQEEALRSFYMQYGLGQLRKYYYSLVKLSADGVEGISLKTYI